MEKGIKNKFNFAIQWHITERCQNRCRHCYMYDDDYQERLKCEKTIADYIKILKNIESFEEKYQVLINNYVITGGDPLAHQDCYKLFKELKRRNKEIHILGIPERITKDTVHSLKENGILSYQVSLDGMKETHDSIRGEGSYERTIQALKVMNQYGLDSSVMYTLSSKNYKEIFELIKELDRNQIHTSFAFDFLVFHGNGVQYNKLLSKDDVIAIFKKYRELKDNFKEKVSTIRLVEKPPILQVFDRDGIFQEDKYTAYSVCSGCYCGYSSIAILPNGDVYPCRRLPIKLGNLLEDTFEDVFLNNPVMKKLRRQESYEECGNCKKFKVCRGCPALAYSLAGNAFSKMPYCYWKEDKSIQVKDDSIVETREEIEILKSTFLNKLYNSKEDELFSILKLFNENVYTNI